MTSYDLANEVTPKELSQRYKVPYLYIIQSINSGLLKAINVGDGSARPRWVVNIDVFRTFITEHPYVKKPRGGYRKPKVMEVTKEVIIEVESDKLKELNELKRKLMLVSNELLELTIRIEELCTE